MAPRKKQAALSDELSSGPDKKKPKSRSSEPLNLQFLKEFKHSQVKHPNYKELAEFDDILTQTFIDRV